MAERIDKINSGDVLKNPVVALAAGTAAVAVEGGKVAARLVTSLPVVGPLVRRGVSELTARGDQVIKQGLDPARALVTAVVVQVIEHVLAELDLTALVREQVDIDAIAADIDIDAIIDAHRPRRPGQHGDRRRRPPDHHSGVDELRHRRGDDRRRILLRGNDRTFRRNTPSRRCTCSASIR